jgi:hypothetical protein
MGVELIHSGDRWDATSAHSIKEWVGVKLSAGVVNAASLDVASHKEVSIEVRVVDLIDIQTFAVSEFVQ